MERLTFYRIEGVECGSGMYSAHFSFASEEMDCDPEHHPLPWADAALVSGGYLPHIRNWHFAFRDLHQLKAWVYEERFRQGLVDEGLHLVTFEANGIYGDTQAVYDPETRGPHTVLDLLTI